MLMDSTSGPTAESQRSGRPGGTAVPPRTGSYRRGERTLLASAKYAGSLAI